MLDVINPSSQKRATVLQQNNLESRNRDLAGIET